MMKKCFLLAAVLFLCFQASAEGVSGNWFNKKEKKTSNHAIGLSLMGKTFKSNGVSMSYLVAEQGTMAFGASVDFDYEKMIKKTPLGVLTGFRAEYTRPYYNGLNDAGNQVKVWANEVTVRVPLMLQYHDKIGASTELLLFAGPSVDFVVFRKGGGSMGGDTFLFGSSMESGTPTAWRWVGASFNYGIGISYNDITFKLSTGYGLLNHFKKDYTAQYLGYPVYINHPIVGSVMFNW